MEEAKIDLSKYQNSLGIKNKIVRLLWSIVWNCLFRPLPKSAFLGWKRFILRIFGAKIASTAVIHSSVKIFYPSHLIMDENSCLASGVDCYNVNVIHIGANSTVSQRAYLCTASHDITNSLNPLISAPIHIGDQAWIAAEAFVGMGVSIGQGAVVGARAVVVKDVEPWTVVGGNPAKFIKKRVISN